MTNPATSPQAATATPAEPSRNHQAQEPRKQIKQIRCPVSVIVSDDLRLSQGDAKFTEKMILGSLK